MRNLRPVKDPRQHFATFWKEKNPDGSVRASELRVKLGEVATRIREGDFLVRLLTVELLPATEGTSAKNSDGTRAESTTRKVPGVYWVVPGDVLEMALLALELVEQEGENERSRERAEAERITKVLDEDEGE